MSRAHYENSTASEATVGTERAPPPRALETVRDGEKWLRNTHNYSHCARPTVKAPETAAVAIKAPVPRLSGSPCLMK